ncbi:type II secretion system protein [Candidatus Saccharibacteria bacterium]|nr:type II secretion system protein [Candidatus Saccharibacteria bacterium]
MAKNNTNLKKGFTIIEVVLVLAIAGLIFLMVFVALPALQRSQRDTARRNDLSRVDTSLTQYQTNNQNTTNGDLPTAGSWTATEDGTFGTGGCGDNTACRFVQRYMNSGTDSATNTFKDPDGTYYSMNIQSASTWGNNEIKDIVPAGNMNYIVYVVTGAKCTGEQVQKDTARHYAVLYRLEGAGIYCIDDQ